MSGSRPVVGCDVVHVARIHDLLARREGAAERVFSAAELADAGRGGVALDSGEAIERLAARFAAKEATRKLFGGRGPGLTAIEVRTDASGRPSVWIAGAPTPLSLSLSHDGGLALAVVVATEDDVASVLSAHAADGPDSGSDTT